jgi:hypothetical protein
LFEWTIAGNVVPLRSSKPFCPGGPREDSTVSRSRTVLLQRKNMTIARARSKTPPIEIPAIAASGSPVWCGIWAGMAVEVGFDVVLEVEVAVEVEDVVLDETVELGAGVPRKSAAIFGSLLNLIPARSLVGHPSDAQGLLLQHPKNAGLVPVHV